MSRSDLQSKPELEQAIATTLRIHKQLPPPEQEQVEYLEALFDGTEGTLDLRFITPDGPVSRLPMPEIEPALRAIKARGHGVDPESVRQVFGFEPEAGFGMPSLPSGLVVIRVEVGRMAAFIHETDRLRRHEAAP